MVGHKSYIEKKQTIYLKEIAYIKFAIVPGIQFSKGLVYALLTYINKYGKSRSFLRHRLVEVEKVGWFAISTTFPQIHLSLSCYKDRI